MKATTTKRIVITAMLATLTCIATMIIQIPSPLKGFLNLGDGVVLFAGWMLDPLCGALAAGLGSALADLLSGYVVYAPATFVIKAAMALVAFYGVKLLHDKPGDLPARILTGVVAEITMILGYFVFEGFLYGFAASVVNIPANGVQGAAGLVLGCLLIKVFRKAKLTL